ncbi:MAG TPA: DNA repair protein RecN [Bacteroidaceae bacterium]|nr:DNA repair protein RecN [Bacteroidaceae bacterium]
MLKSINIRNYVLIDRLDITFSSGFSVMTGETGAGKSIIIGAVNLLLGSRADSRQILHETDKCTIEGHFSIDGYGLEPFFYENGLDMDPDDTILRREISQSGKSRAFINDTPVTLSQMRELGCRLIDIHSQHQSLALGTQPFQLEVVDTIARNDEIKAAYQSRYDRYSELKERLDRTRALFESDTSDREYLEFQLEGLENARLTDGEQEELEMESDILSHAEEIKQELFHAAEILDGDYGDSIQNLRQALQALNSIGKNYPAAIEYAQRLESCLIELKDLAGSVHDSYEKVSYDPDRLEQVNSRLDLIYSLQKKHKVNSAAQLIELADTIRKRLDKTASYEDEIEVLTAQLAKARTEMEEAALQLTKSRKKASETIIKDIKELLVPLGIPAVQFDIVITNSDSYDRTGHDDLKFMFSANRSVPMQELAAVASGGEIARVMLSIKSLIADVRTIPTVIFDEIDTGVSGAAAEKMALLMKRMSTNDRQVLAITHLPQIAAMGQIHYKIYKIDEDNATRTRILLLEEDERIREIASMMSGSRLTQAALDNAKALTEQWKMK